MVCSVGKGRMEALAKLLEAGSFTQIVPKDEARHQKLVTKEICRELSEADEANLVDERDMHVFGLKPLADPLNLVSCNLCKRTITASQHAAHAALCKFMRLQEAHLEFDGYIGHRKKPRKERKKSSRYPTYQPMTMRVQMQLKSPKVDDPVTSKLCLDDQVGKVSSMSTVTDDSLDGMPKLDVSSVNSGYEDLPAAVVGHPKGLKLIDANSKLLPDDRKAQDAKCIRDQDGQKCEGSSKATIVEQGKCDQELSDHPKTSQVQFCLSPKGYVLAPLATKIYYSQRSNHLRSALSLMFYKASATKQSSNSLYSEEVEGNLMSPEMTSFVDELENGLPDQEDPDYPLIGHQPEVGFQVEADFGPTASISIITPGNTSGSLGMLKLKRKHMSQSYSFTDNSGTVVEMI